MNDTSSPAPEPDSGQRSDSTPAAADTSPPAPDVSEPSEPPSDASPSTGPGTGHRLLITLLFLALGLAGGTGAWWLQSRFTVEIMPLAASGIPGEPHPDPDISLYGLEYVIQALGIPPRQSSFTVFPESPGGSSNSTSINTAVEMANINRELSRRRLDITPRRNRVAVYLLLLGISFGVAIGLAEGIRRRSIVMLIGGALISPVLAGAAGFLGGALHARVANAMQSTNLDADVALMVPQFAGWFVLAVGLCAWPAAIKPNSTTALNLLAAAAAGALLYSMIYVLAAQQIFFDDPLAHSLPCHIYSFLFWYLFGSGMLSLTIGDACANIRR